MKHAGKKHKKDGTDETIHRDACIKPLDACDVYHIIRILPYTALISSHSIWPRDRTVQTMDDNVSPGLPRLTDDSAELHSPRPPPKKRVSQEKRLRGTIMGFFYGLGEPTEAAWGHRGN